MIAAVTGSPERRSTPSSLASAALYRKEWWVALVSKLLFGWVMEVHNQTTELTNWLSYRFGVFAAAIPWIAIAVYLFGPAASGDQGPPAFVHWISLSIFLFFDVFALKMVLQHKKIGRWGDHLYGERAHIVLSLVAKSLLGRQVFTGTHCPD